MAKGLPNPEGNLMFFSLSTPLLRSRWLWKSFRQSKHIRLRSRHGKFSYMLSLRWWKRLPRRLKVAKSSDHWCRSKKMAQSSFHFSKLMQRIEKRGWMKRKDREELRMGRGQRNAQKRGYIHISMAASQNWLAPILASQISQLVISDLP